METRGNQDKRFWFSRVSLAITQKASQRHLKKKALERLCIAESYEQGKRTFGVCL